MRRARAQAPSALIAGRETGDPEIVERADGAFVRRRPAISDETPASAQENYGSHPRRTSSFPVDRTRVITADRVIPATLQTSINSRLPGEVRAIVTQNVMGADGRLVLIPARTALLGRYEGAMPGGGTAAGGGRALRVGDVRLAIRWVRMIRPDGAHVVIDDAGYDAMGRSGLIGEVDNRVFERFFGAALVSTMTVGGAMAQGYLAAGAVAFPDAISNGPARLVARMAPPGRGPMKDGMRQAIDRMSNFAEQMLREGMNLEPIITIPQGTQFFVVPRDDIWFPAPKQASAARGGVLETRIVRRPEAPGMRLFGGDQDDRAAGGDSAN
ncbi:MAG: TrbI/VirB10 family protein [Alphaproteobacteria bacterium]|nr:TrbI/VirB10 family protein [Alphaproteobacteria bacterium]